MLQWKSNVCYTTWVSVFVALGSQHAMRMRHIVICGLPHATTFFHLISGRIFENQLLNTKLHFDFLYMYYMKHFSFYEEIKDI
jgi:hypothetical protein